MDWQLTISGIAVVLAGAYLAWRAVGLFRPRDGACSGGCGCAKETESPQPSLIAPEQLASSLRGRSPSEPEA
ncbi:MAG: hypothetical protein HYR84_07015 [Planctomycetes bacterium]|nr:hypothetical protein [Planctomycetota bacterium]